MEYIEGMRDDEEDGLIDLKGQCSDDDDEFDDELFLPKSALGRRASVLSDDSGILQSRQTSVRFTGGSASASATARPETAEHNNPKSGASFTRSSTVTSGYRSAAATAPSDTPVSGWLPRVNNSQPDDREKQQSRQSGWTGLSRLIRENSSKKVTSSIGSASPALRGVSRADSFRDVDTSPCFVAYTPEPKKPATPVFKFLPQAAVAEPPTAGPPPSTAATTLPPVSTAGQPLVKDPVGSKRRKCSTGSSEQAARSSTQVSGMTKYGVCKDGIMRTVMIFTEPPRPRPLSVCFHYPKNFLTHRYVLDQVKNQIHTVPNGYVTALQFIDRNVLHGAVGLENRWVITLSGPEARDHLLRMGIKLFNRKINMRRADEIINEEYREYQKYQRLLKKLHGEIPPEELDTQNVDKTSEDLSVSANITEGEESDGSDI